MAKRKKPTTIRHSGPPIDDQLTVIEYLSDILDGARQLAKHLDTQINILIGVCTAIFLFAVSQLRNEDLFPVFLLFSVTAAFATIASLFAIHPPRFMSKRGQQESLMYNKEILSSLSPETYAKRINDVLRHQSSVYEQYLTETYNIYKYYYQPKRWLFHLSRNALMLGIVAGFLAFVLQQIHTP